MATRKVWRWVMSWVCLWLASTVPGHGATGSCGVPPVVAPNAQPNIFSEQQEQWLGEAMAKTVEADFNLVRDPEQNAFLQLIADKLAATLPATNIPFRVRVIDSPEVNGFSIAGGRIYLTRKLAAAARTDDELASVIGHEMGHIASHQFAFETTRDMKRLLNVVSVGDRADVFAKFQQLTEARLKAKSTSGGDNDEKQDEADRIGVYVVAAAGFRPQASAEFWDRMFFTNGRKGGRVSDFFGLTKPNERRLGRISRLVAELPPGCGGQEPVRDEAFAAWHERVVANRAVKALPVEGATELALTPSLRMDLDRLRFSPDGRYVLAQDEGSVMVISAEDHHVIFQTEAQNALPAQFSPDSKRLVFTTQGLHTEMWDIAEKRMVEAHEPLAKNPCLQAKISPDGRTVICMALEEAARQISLSLLDAATGAVVWKKDNFFDPSVAYLVVLYLSGGDEWAGDLVPSSFSADGNFLLIGPGSSKLAFDLRTRTPVKVGGDLHSSVDGPYAFVGSDRVAGRSLEKDGHSGLFTFPEGKLVHVLPILSSKLISVSASSGPPYVIGDGLKDFELGLADLDQGRMVIGSHSEAMDVWGGTLVYESVEGSVVFRKLAGAKDQGEQKFHLPLSDLGTLRAVAVSPDGGKLAFSTRTRGGVWNLQTGKQELLLNGFDHASWAADGQVYVEFPKREKQDRQVLRVSVVTRKGSKLPYELGKRAMEYGVLREWTDLAKEGKQITVSDLADGKQLWVKQFPEGMPGYTMSVGSGDVLFSSRLDSSLVKSRVKANETLAAEAATIKKRENGRLVEAVDPKTGVSNGVVVIDLPGDYAGAEGLNRVGDLLYVTTKDNRTLVYSMRDGNQVRAMYGTMMAADAATGRVCLHERTGELVLADAAGVELGHVTVGKPLRHVTFAKNGAELWLLGADQVVRTVPVGVKTAEVLTGRVSAP